MFRLKRKNIFFHIDIAQKPLAVAYIYIYMQHITSLGPALMEKIYSKLKHLSSINNNNKIVLQRK